MTQFNLPELVDYIKTSRRASLLLTQVDEMSDLLYTSNSGDFQSVIEDKFDDNLSKFMSGYFLIHNIDTKDINSIRKFLQELKPTIKQLHQVKLLLAIEPTGIFVDKLHLWAKQNVSNVVLLNIEVNPAILGGAIIIFKGLYRDISLAPQIDSYFVEKRDYVQKLFA